MRPRNRELLALIPAALLLTAGLTAVFVQQSNRLSTGALVYGAVFLGLCLAGHIFIRIALPDADPYIFPLVSVLACFGLVMIYTIAGTTYARQQAQWFVIGLVLLGLTVIVCREYRKLEGVPISDHDRLAGAAGAAARARPRGADQRRLPGDQAAGHRFSADRVREDRPGRVPRQLPAG